MKWKQIVIGHFITLCLGSFIYIVFRSRSLIMFQWFEEWNLMNGIHQLRSVIGTVNLPDFILYALPDGLWMFSYMSIVLYLWDNSVEPENIFWVFAIPVIAMASEAGQYFSIIPGTYDMMDLVLYAMGTLLPLLLFKVEITNFKSIDI